MRLRIVYGDLLKQSLQRQTVATGIYYLWCQGLLMKPLASPHIMKNSLLFTLALLSFGLCHPAVKDIHHGTFNKWAHVFIRSMRSPE